ncbi:MAG: 4Fe-4S binding protein [Anaerolineae bacterium]|nr:4Fe-4S binding protein [Anaerolineae bacterium]
MLDWVLPEIDKALCDRCGACVALCPAGAVDMTPQGPVVARPADCTYCTQCEAICPQGAIRCAFEIVWAPEGG